jgi:hypothetical protein
MVQLRRQRPRRERPHTVDGASALTRPCPRRQRSPCRLPRTVSLRVSAGAAKEACRARLRRLVRSCLTMIAIDPQPRRRLIGSPVGFVMRMEFSQGY